MDANAFLLEYASHSLRGLSMTVLPTSLVFMVKVRFNSSIGIDRRQLIFSSVWQFMKPQGSVSFKHDASNFKLPSNMIAARDYSTVSSSTLLN